MRCVWKFDEIKYFKPKELCFPNGIKDGDDCIRATLTTLDGCYREVTTNFPPPMELRFAILHKGKPYFIDDMSPAAEQRIYRFVGYTRNQEFAKYEEQ